MIFGRFWRYYSVAALVSHFPVEGEGGSRSGDYHPIAWDEIFPFFAKYAKYRKFAVFLMSEFDKDNMMWKRVRKSPFSEGYPDETCAPTIFSIFYRNVCNRRKLNKTCFFKLVFFFANSCLSIKAQATGMISYF